MLENLAGDDRIVRNLQKIRTVPENARMVVEAASEYGSFGNMLAQWPSDDQAGLLLWLKRHGARLGGNTAQYFLRMVGWDGFILSQDVLAVLRLEGLLDASPGSKRRCCRPRVPLMTGIGKPACPTAICQRLRPAASSVKRFRRLRLRLH